MQTVAVVAHEVRVHTQDFRIYGRLHARPHTGTTWLLNADDRPHLPMTEVAMYRAGVEHPPKPADLVYQSHFAAIPKAHVVWVQGGAPDEAKDGLGLRPREVFLVFPTYVLAGEVAMRPEVRLSDFVGLALTKKSFVTLTRARVLDSVRVTAALADLPAVQSHDYLTVDLRKVAAVFDVRGGDPALAYRVEV
jgi:hypothetical protein